MTTANIRINPATAKTCFVIMPFSATRRPKMSEDDWLEVFENTFKPPFEELGYICTRSVLRPGNFVKDILDKLRTADIVLADLSGQRPNVFYELGVRHTLRSSGTIIVAQDFREVPSDLVSYSAFAYNWRSQHGRKAFASKIREIVSGLENETHRSDNPVHDFLTLPWGNSQPTLEILPGNSSQLGTQVNDSRPRAAFANVQVINAGRFLARVRGSIRFLHLDGSDIFHREMPIRWSGAPEPLTPILANTDKGQELTLIPDFSKVPLSLIADFAPKEQNAFAVAIKFESGDCWGWTVDSYFHDWHHPDWPLPSEPLKVRVTLVADGLEFVKEFALNAAASPSEFVTRDVESGMSSGDSAVTRNTSLETMPIRPSGVSSPSTRTDRNQEYD